MRIAPPWRFRFHPAMRFPLLLLCSLTLAFSTTHAASSSAPFEAALKSFRAEGPPGWSFTQITEAEGQSRVERYDAAQPAFSRWTLLQQNGRAPTPDELQDYMEKISRRSRAGTPPRLADQLDLPTLAVLDDSTERTIYQARLKDGEDGDATAKFLRATVVFHRPTHTIESFELASTGPFSPVLGVKIAEMKTTMVYTLPDGDRPSFLQKSTTRLRGRAFFLKSLDADMTVSFTDYEPARRPKQRPAP